MPPHHADKAIQVALWKKNSLGSVRRKGEDNGMIPSLFTTTVLTALLLLGLSLPFILNLSGWRKALERFPRSELAAWITMGPGGAWFLFEVWHLSPADELFGPMTRFVLFGLFGIAWLGSFFVVKDFLSVRGLSVLILMASAVILESAWGEYEIPSRLFLVTFIYILLTLAIWVGVSPFRFRDFIQWLYRNPLRPRALGGFLGVYGLILLAVAFTY